MATITGLTAERMQEIIDSTIVDADVIADNLILTKDDGSTINAGNVRGAQGVPGANASNLGKGAAFPAAPTDGDLFVRTDQVGDPLYKFTDGAWASAGGGLNKVTGFPASPQDGDVIVRTDLNGSPMFAYSTENGWEQTPRMGRVTVPAVSIRRTANFSVPTGAYTAVALDAANSTEDFDTDGMHDPATNPSRITIKTPGLYLLEGGGEFASGGGAVRYTQIHKNGTVIPGSQTGGPLVAGWGTRQTTSVMVRCAAGDYLELVGFQDSGGALTWNSVAFAATWLGGAGQTVDERGVPAARAKMATPQAITSAINTYVAFDAEDYDTDGIHDTAVNTTRLTIKTPGLYIVQAGIVWPTTSATGMRHVVIQRNRTDSLSEQDSPGSTVAGPVMTTGGVYNLAAGDYLEVLVRQDSGGSLTIPADLRCFLAATLVGSGKIVTPYARVYRTTSQTVPQSTSAYVSYDAERSDNDGIHDNVSNTSRMTCNTAGVYAIMGHVAVTGGTRGRLCIVKNRTDYLAVVDLIFSNSKYTLINTISELAVGDYIELFVIEDSAASAIVLSASVGSTTQYMQDLEMVKIGAPNAGQSGVEAVEGWHSVGGVGEPAFQNSWQTATVLKFKKDRGVTYIMGTAGVTGNAGTVFTLPPGYRPIGDGWRTFQRDNTGATVQVDVDTSGNVTSSVSKSSGGWVNMGMSFRND